MVKHKVHLKQKNGSVLEQMALLVAIIEPLSIVPQIIQIYQTGNAGSIELGIIHGSIINLARLWI